MPRGKSESELHPVRSFDYEQYQIKHDGSTWVPFPASEHGMAQTAQDSAEYFKLEAGTRIFVQPIPEPPPVTVYTMTDKWVRWDGRADER